jgi:hypothetical protein
MRCFSGGAEWKVVGSLEAAALNSTSTGCNCGKKVIGDDMEGD